MYTIKNSISEEHNFCANYSPSLLVLDHGKGAYLYDKEGKEYLDFTSGIAVNALGYGDKEIEKVATDQLKKLIHCSNLFTTEPALELASLLTKREGFDAVHFGNSGTEANEAALKYARLYSRRNKGEGNHKILSFSHGFHGRTMGSLSVTHNKGYKTDFTPLIPGTFSTPFNDIEALKEVLDSTFAAVIVEVVQGEGGLETIDSDFAFSLRELCDHYNILIIADEVQTGIGRTGTLFASDQFPLRPDIITLAKPLAGGLPLSATLIPEKINKLLKPGDHGSTFGGGPVPCALGSYIWKRINTPLFLDNVNNLSLYLKKGFERLQSTYDQVGEVKGLGLLLGLEIKEEGNFTCSSIIGWAKERGLLILKSGKSTLRFAPPLIISEKEIDKAIIVLGNVIEQLLRNK